MWPFKKEKKEDKKKKNKLDKIHEDNLKKMEIEHEKKKK